MTTNKQLRELAEKAGVQEWGQDKGDVVALGGWPGSSGPLVLASANENFPEHALNTAAYVAAANPAAVLALLDEIEALQAECEKLRNLLVEIERGCSRRDMPSEQTISSWADAIDAAIHAAPQEVSP